MQNTPIGNHLDTSSQPLLEKPIQFKNAEEFTNEQQRRFMELLGQKDRIVKIMLTILNFASADQCDEMDKVNSLYESAFKAYSEIGGFNKMSFDRLEDFFSNPDNADKLSSYLKPVNEFVVPRHTVVILDQEYLPENTRYLTNIAYHGYVVFDEDGGEVEADPVTGLTPYPIEYGFLKTNYIRKSTNEQMMVHASLVLEYLTAFLIRESHESILNDELKLLDPKNDSYRAGALKNNRFYYIVTGGDKNSSSVLTNKYMEEILALRDGMNRSQEQGNHPLLAQIINFVSEDLAPTAGVPLQQMRLGKSVRSVLNKGFSMLASLIDDYKVNFLKVFGTERGTYVGELNRRLFRNLKEQ